jgi:tail-anchored protein insertion receptor
VRTTSVLIHELGIVSNGITEAAYEGTKIQFDNGVGYARFAATSGLKAVLPFWYAKQPMFWLPHGFFPYYVEWFLSFPRAPLGSISIATWQVACMGIIVLFSDLIKKLVLGQKAGVKEPPVTGEKTDGKAKVPSEKTKPKPEASGEKTSASEEKKEL